MSKVRVLMVEDSAYMRFKLKSFVEGDPRFEIVGIARDGQEALELVERLKPQVISLDLELPKVHGLEVLKQVMERRPTPVVLVSAFTKEGADQTIRGLELGAVAFVAKPTPGRIGEIQTELTDKLFEASRANLSGLKTRRAARASSARCAPAPGDADLIVIGASIGGPQALRYLLPQFPANFPVPIVVVQHMPEGYTGRFARSLHSHCRISVKEARDGALLIPETVYVAAGGKHLVIAKGKKIRLEERDLVNNVRPSVDVTLISASRVYGRKLVAVILTGMGRDGTHGAVEVKKHGGTVIAQSEESCIVYGMSRSVIEAGACDHQLSLESIPGFLLEKYGCLTS